MSANAWNWLDDGTYYMLTRNRISQFSFKGIDNCSSKVIINDINIDEKVYRHPKLLEIGDRVQRVTINLAVLSFMGTVSVHISYYLNGFNNERMVLADSWNGSISYTKLSEGECSFELVVYNPEKSSENKK